MIFFQEIDWYFSIAKDVRIIFHYKIMLCVPSLLGRMLHTSASEMLWPAFYKTIEISERIRGQGQVHASVLTLILFEKM